MSQKLNFTFLILLLTSCVMSSLSLAQSSDEAIGKTRLVLGGVTVSSVVSGEGPLKAGDNIFLGDQVSTPATGYAVITLNEGSKFTIKPKSEFRFDAVDESDGKVITNLIAGGLKSITGSIGASNPEGFKVNTPLGSIGIRGTNFDALLCLSEEDCSLMHEALGCPDSEPAPIVGLLYVTVSDGIAYLDQCDEDINISAAQTGTSDGTKSNCTLLEETPCFLRKSTFEQVDIDIEQPDERESRADDIVLLCQGDPVCILCDGDAACSQCDGDALCMACQGDNLCRSCQGESICMQCDGDATCLACDGDPLCQQCNGDQLCIDCEADASCIAGPEPEEPEVPVVDPCDGDALCLLCLNDSNPALCESCEGVDNSCYVCAFGDEMCECQFDPNQEICQPEVCTPVDTSGCPGNCAGSKNPLYCFCLDGFPGFELFCQE
ncbi:MAG: hypothetical protein ACI9J2_000467 [Saprospiraceae bacterium]|jgi:hypothetical protein